MHAQFLSGQIQFIFVLQEISLTAVEESWNLPEFSFVQAYVHANHSLKDSSRAGSFLISGLSNLIKD